MLFPKKFIIQTGGVARACLAPGQRGKVLAAFSQAIYLQTEAGELFWIATEDAPLHQRCARISAHLPGFSVGSPFHVEDQRLTIDPGLIFDVGHASLWSAPHLDLNRVLEIAQLATRLHVFFSQLDFAQAKGFGTFIPHILSLAQNESIDPALTLTDPVLRFAHPFVLDMARACLDRQPLRISKHADALIGLGAGLTPSGDDFLGGLLFAVKTLQAAYPDLNFNHSIPIETYRPRTHVISFTLLRDLASGQASAPLHHIINGLLRGEPFESIYPFIRQLTQIGHSTGWDLLAGLLRDCSSPSYQMIPEQETRRKHHDIKQKIEKANEEAARRLTSGEPVLVDIAPAHEVIPGMKDKMITHAGPPLDWQRMCGAQQGAIIGMVIYEGWAKTPDEARKMLEKGDICLEPNHHHQTVGPMAGTI
jgi:hypothetical protein